MAAARGGVGVSETSVRLSAAGSSCGDFSQQLASRSALRDHEGLLRRAGPRAAELATFVFVGAKNSI